MLGRAISTSPWRKKTLRTPFFQGFSPDFRKKKPIPKHSMYMVHPYHTQIEQKEVNISCFQCCGIRTSFFQNVKDVNFQDLKKCWNLLEINWQNVEMCHIFYGILSQGWHDFGPKNLNQSPGSHIFIFIGTICGGLVCFRKMSEGEKSATLSKGQKCHNMTKVQAFQTSFQVLIFTKLPWFQKLPLFQIRAPLGYLKSLIN